MRLQLQTGSARGSIKRGAPHPTVPNRFFWAYITRDDNPSFERWLSQESIDKNYEHKRKASKPYYARTKEVQAAQTKERRRLNPELFKERAKEYYENNKARCIAKDAARKADLSAQYNALKDSERKTIINFYTSCRRISECLGVQFNIDHITPISRGGKHAPQNLQITPERWNKRKSNSNSDVFQYNKQHTPTAKKLS